MYRLFSGYWQTVRFLLDLRKADVDMVFRYEKLRIRIMKEKDGELQSRSHVLQSIFRGERRVGTVFDFEDNTSFFQYFECVPLACGDINAIFSLQGIQ